MERRKKSKIKSKMKRGGRWIAWMLCFAMVFSLAACGKKTEEKKETGETTEGAAPAQVDPEIEEILSSMSTRDKVEQMMIVSYRIWKQVPGDTDINSSVENADEEIPEIEITELNGVFREDIRVHHYGGTLLFSENCRTAEQTLKLVADIQKTNQEGGGYPMIVAADQEGGNISRLDFGTYGVGNMLLAATGDPENAREMASIYGKELGLLGINTDFAPVMDVNNNPNNPVIGNRSFSDSPELVAEYGTAYLSGLHETGTIATLKHFPGHGNTDTDSHTGFPCINRSLDELKAFELVPFQKAIDSGADMVMTAHIQYPQIETETYTSISTGEKIYIPATMSHTILTDVLRNDMGFRGVVVTDALDMAAISENFSDDDVVTMTINAGADMLILPIITDSAVLDRVRRMTDSAVSLTEKGIIDPERVDASVRRILTLKKKYGLLEKKDFTVTDEMISAAKSGVGSKESREAAWTIAEKGLTLVKSDSDSFPIRLQEGEKALILFGDCCGSRVGTGEYALNRLKDGGTLQDTTAVTVMLNDSENEEECLKAANEADHVILVHRTYDADNMNPNTENGLSSAVFDKIIAARHEAGKKVIVVTMQLPYDAARFPDADTLMLTYDSCPMRELPPETGEGSAIVPNLAAALCVCFGQGEAGGKLPVNVPRLDENYQMTDEIMYERAQ